MDELVSYEVRDGVATLTIDDGKVNAFSISMLRALHAAFDRADDEQPAVVVLRGREGCFSAGFDLSTLSAGGGQVVEMLTLGATLAERILAHRRPVLTACTGHALPAGAFLLLAADCRIGVEGPFRIGLNEVRIGLTVPLFAIALARQRLRPADFDRTVVTGALYDPHAARAAGFLDLVVPAAELPAAVEAAARDLAGIDAEAHAATKLRARAGSLRALRAAIESELDAAAPLSP
jgi:enoyl-CoA hydratase